MMSTETLFRAEVDTGEGTWYTNGLRFKSEIEAQVYAQDLAARWTLVRRWRVVDEAVPLRETVIAEENR